MRDLATCRRKASRVLQYLTSNFFLGDFARNLGQRSNSSEEEEHDITANNFRRSLEGKRVLTVLSGPVFLNLHIFRKQENILFVGEIDSTKTSRYVKSRI